MPPSIRLSEFDNLTDRPVFKALLRAAQATTCHLVGGYLRDLLVGLPSRDIDAVVGDGAGEKVAERLAALLPARLVDLGRGEFAAYRLVASGVVVDLWDRRSMSVSDDLMRRDFTINSFALDLSDGSVIDPAGGIADLGRGMIRATTSRSFAEDPLRVLRLPRMAALLPDFAIDRETLRLAAAERRRLCEVSTERIREELRLLFEMSGFRRGFPLLNEMDVLPRPRAIAVGDEGAQIDRALARIEQLATAIEVQAANAGCEGTGTVDLAACRWIAALEGTGDEPPAGVARIRTVHDLGFLTRALRDRLLALGESREVPQSRIESRRFLHRFGGDWASALVIAAVRSPVADLTESFASLAALVATEGESLFAPPRLVDGAEVGRILGVPPGPEIGRALAEIERRQVGGSIRTRDQALAWLVSRSDRRPDS